MPKLCLFTDYNTLFNQGKLNFTEYMIKIRKCLSFVFNPNFAYENSGGKRVEGFIT